MKEKKIIIILLDLLEKIDNKIIDMGVDDEILDCCNRYDINGVELRRYINHIVEEAHIEVMNINKEDDK